MKKTKSKMLSLLLAFVMVLALMPTVAFAADDMATATNGMTITSATTQDELNKWAGEGAIEIATVDGVTTVKLLKNFNFPGAKNPIIFGDVLNNPNEVMVLDLNGHSITSTTIVVQSGCDLTIKDSGSGGKISLDTNNDPGKAYSAVVNQKKLTIEGGIFEAKIHESNSVSGSVIGSAVIGVETVVNGGTFESNCSAISVTSGTTTVNGGTFTAGAYGIVARGTAVVNFPTDTQATVTSNKFPIVVGTNKDSAGQVNIDGGDFTGTNASALVGGTGGVTPTDLVKISGGSFTNSPMNYVETNASVVKDATSYEVGANATTLVKNATAGDTLTLLQYGSEITVPEGVEINNQTGGAITVNGNTVGNAQQVTTTHNIIETEAKAATCTQAGNIAYWYCRICDKYYSDKACMQEIELKDTVVKTAHTYKDGKCTVCGAADLSYKPGIQPGGTTDTGKAVPQTGDNTNIALYLVLMLASGVGLTGAVDYSRKKKST